jgi:CRP-like cAMP-binding protein
MTDIVEFLQGHPYFAGLNRAALARVARLLAPRPVERDEHILFEGDAPRAAYLIAHGRFRIYRLSPGGREQALMDLLPGQTFNLVPAIDGRPVVSNVVARTNGLLYVLERDDLLYLIRAHPSLAEAVLVDFCGRLRQLTGLVEDLSLRTVPERLARLLVGMANDDADGPRRFTQQELAARLGTVREVISRTLKSFEGDGLIRTERHRITILDYERLNAIACQVE